MKRRRRHPETKDFEEALAAPRPKRYVLRLFVTGATPRSLRAVQNIRRLCEEYLKDTYSLDIVDVYQQPVLARGEQIVAAPTLIKYHPLPVRRFIGDMANTGRLVLGLELRPMP